MPSIKQESIRKQCWLSSSVCVLLQDVHDDMSIFQLPIKPSATVCCQGWKPCRIPIFTFQVIIPPIRKATEHVRKWCMHGHGTQTLIFGMTSSLQNSTLGLPKLEEISTPGLPKLQNFMPELLKVSLHQHSTHACTKQHQEQWLSSKDTCPLSQVYGYRKDLMYRLPHMIVWYSFLYSGRTNSKPESSASQW